MNPVPPDERHRWLDEPIERRAAWHSFCAAWHRQRVPFLMVHAITGLRADPFIRDRELVLLFAHQHVKLTPIEGQWCCPVVVDPTAADQADGSCHYCTRPAHARGMCELHYMRWRRTGDPTIRNPAGRVLPPDVAANTLVIGRQVEVSL